MSRKSSRKARHQNAATPNLGRGAPPASSGRNGEQQFRNIPGEGLVHMVRTDGGWQKVATSKGGTSQGDSKADLPISITTGAAASTGTGGGTTTDSHTGLLNLDADDHPQYVHISTNRAITAAHTFSGNTAFTGIPTFTNIDVNGGNITGITDLAVADGGTGVSTSDSWLNSRITTNANGTLNYDATSAVAPNHDNLAGFVADEHIDWTSTSENFSTSGTAAMADLTVTTTNNVKLSLRETSTHKVDFTVGDTGQLTIHPSGNSFMLHNDSNMGSTSFVSGFAGSGWQLSKDSANEYTAEFDNLTVRGTMSVYELLIQQIRASNGSVIIGSADKVVAVEQISGSSYKFTVESDEADGGSNGNDFIHFKEDDLIIAQKWSGTSGDPPYTPVKRVRATVTETSNSGGSSLDAKEFKATLYSTDSIASGDLPLDFVRIGNTSDADRQGGIYLTSEDSGAPFIDIFDDVDSWADWRLATKTKARLGRLDGINYDDGSGSGFDIPDTYGLFSKDVYLTGKITATSGFIGDNDAGWEIGSNYLKNVGNTSFIGIGSGGYNSSNQYVWLGAAASGGSTVGKFSLGDKLTWDGSNLYVKGQLILTNGDSVGAGITWKGTYNAGVAYVKNDAVVYQSASYIALQSTTGNTPSSGSSYWDLLADQGATGQQGNDGAPGNNGSPGSDGHVYKQFYVYKNGSSAPSTPSNGSVNSSAVMTPPSGWSNTPSTPSSGQFTYASTSVWKQTNGSGSYAIDTAWASPSKFSGDTGAQGETGETGQTGQTGQTGNTGPQGPAGDDGAPGSNGAPGTRGSRHYYYTVTGNSWSDSDANTAISNAGDTKVDRDTVTLSKANTFSTTKYWDGDSWESIAQVVDGNLIVHGTVGANQVDANDIFTQSISVTNSIILGTGGKLYTNGKTSIADNTTGIFIGHDGSSNYDLAIGDGTNHVKWDGSAGTMTIRGTLNADDIVAGTITGRTVRTAASGDRIVMDGSANSISLIDSNDYTRVVIDDNDNPPDDNPGYNTIINHGTDQEHSWDNDEQSASWDDGNYGTWNHVKGRQCQVRIEFYAMQGDSTTYVKVLGYSGGTWYQLAFDSHSFSNSGSTIVKYLHYTSGNATSFKVQVKGEHDEGGLGNATKTTHMYVREYKQASYLNHTGMHWVGNGIYSRLGPNTETLPSSMSSNSQADADDAFVCTGNAHLYKKLIFSDEVGTDEDSRWTMQNNSSNNLYFQKYNNYGNQVTGSGYMGSSNVGQIDFTGQHRCIGNSGMTAAQYGAMIGYIVRADGKYNNISDNGTSASINESLPVIELSDSNNDKRVFGVISSHEDNEREYQQGTFVSVYDIPTDDERVIINSLGEGGIWVTNLNGNLENGDYITTSTAAGLGQKQDDDLLHNYTVAKITQDCDFSGGTDFEHNSQTYKKQFVGCTYHCG